MQSPHLHRLRRLVVTSAAIGLGYAFSGPAHAQSASELTLGDPVTANLGSFNIVINAGPGLQANPAALAAFNRAAAQWEARISDPVTITIDADLHSGFSDSSVIGSASPVMLAGGYNLIRDAMVNDAVGEANDTIVGFLPTAAQFTAEVRAGTSLSGSLLFSKANAKALGFAGLDSAFGVSDGIIEFNSNFSFDFDNSNGITAFTMDFETVAAHEIGHTLGFLSEVDSADAGATSLTPTTLDLFRFSNNVAGRDPSTPTEFTNFPRDLRPGGDVILDFIDFEGGMSTGSAMGDGNQASHWKADDLTGTLIGLMDPTLAFGDSYPVGEADLRALDLIGYDINPLLLEAVPEPSTAFTGLLLLGVTGMARWRQRRVSPCSI